MILVIFFILFIKFDNNVSDNSLKFNEFNNTINRETPILSSYKSNLVDENQLFEEIVSSKDAFRCLELKNLELQKTCSNYIRFNIVSSISIEYDNISLCEQLINSDLISECKLRYQNYFEVNN